VREHVDVDAAIAAALLPAFTEPGLAQLAATRNVRLERLRRDAQSGGPAERYKLRPTALRWDSLLCYRGGNEASFLADAGVVLVSGGNGAGKTAFLEVILLALFGEGFPSRTCGSAAVINVACSDASAELDFELDGVAYRVTRRWTRSPKDASRATTKAELFNVAGAKATGLRKGRAAVDEWVSDNVCSSADFLAGPMLSQAGDGDVLMLSGRDGAALLERAYGLAGIDVLGELLTDAGNGLKQVLARADSLAGGVDRETFDAARSEYKAARKASVAIRDALSRVANPASPTAAALDAARAVTAEMNDVGEHDPWAHVRDSQALATVRAAVLPRAGDSPDVPSGCRSRMPFATVAVLWARYSNAVSDLRRYGLTHRELLARPELVKDAAKDAAEEVDYGAELDRLGRESGRAVTAERAARAALGAASSELRRAEDAQADVVAHSLQDHYEACREAWPSAGDFGEDDADVAAAAVALERTRVVVSYLTVAAAAHLPSAAALCESLAVRNDVLDAPTFDVAVELMGVVSPKSRSVKYPSGRSVPECAKSVADAEAALSAAHRVTLDLAEQAASARAALQAQVLSKTDEDALDALRTLEAAWAPLRGVDLDAARNERDAELERLVAAVRKHESRKALSDAQDVVLAAAAVEERRALQADLDALDLDRKAIEWGRVRGCEAVLADGPAIEAARVRAAVVAGAAARLKGVKTWLYSERIAPELAARANAVIAQVEPSLSVACVVSDDGGVSWTVNDGVRAVPPQRASGFQRFMASTALRVVFGSLLAPCALFVVDEGFTACDRDHLSRVPAFLEWLVRSGAADTVVLVSHLTEIREHVARVVDLRRGAPFVA